MTTRTSNYEERQLDMTCKGDSEELPMESSDFLNIITETIRRIRCFPVTFHGF